MTSSRWLFRIVTRYTHAYVPPAPLVSLMANFSFCCGGGGFVGLICLCYFSVCCDEGLERRNLSEKDLF